MSAKLPSSVTERYADLKPQFEDLMKRAAAVTTTEVATFNAAATRAGRRDHDQVR